MEVYLQTQLVQCSLNALHTYCEMWGLKLNINKTKVVIFSRGKVRKIPKFYFNAQLINIFTNYKYLGVLFNYNGSFKEAIRDRCKLASSAMFSLLKKARNDRLPLDIQLELFEKCVKPVLLYGCEIWGFEQILPCNRLQLRFLKMVLGVKKSTSSCMVLGEVGCLPIDIEIKARMLCFWYSHFLEAISGSNKLSVIMFKLCYCLFDTDQLEFKWFHTIRSLLNELGMPFIWKNPVYSINQFKSLIKQRLKDQYLQSWRSNIDQSGVCCNYRMYKINYTLEKYLLILPYSLRLPMLKFRLSNHKLPIHQDRLSAIPRQERKCTLCELNEIGDEFHYIFNCSFPPIKNCRSEMLGRYFQNRPNTIKFSDLMNMQHKSKLVKLAKFIRVILNQFTI